MNRHDGKKKKSDDLKHLNLDDLHVSNANDCTGLIPSTPMSQDELDSYQQLQNSKTT